MGRPPSFVEWMTYIAAMNEVHLGALDLNLLVTLDALLVERNVTRAASRIGITQSAASHALARLRALTGDELLVRGSGGMTPTTRAEELAAPVRRVLADIAQMLAPARTFDPATATMRFAIGTTDYAELVMLPRLVARLAREAPGVELRARNIGADAAGALAAGELDVALSPTRPADERSGIHARKLFDETFVCVVREGHPLARKRLTLARFAAASHALISPRGEEGGFVDDALARRGLRRRVAVAVPHFLVAPYVVASSDLVLTLARRVADLLAAPLRLAVLAPPPELGVTGFTVSAMWHDRTHDDPARRWLREVLVQEARGRGRLP
jgi:DNA-binding transcriptional LysR family regulator